MHKIITQSFVVGGRKQPSAPPKHRLAKYMKTDLLPVPPAEINYAPKAAAGLTPIFGNDMYGDCVETAIAHLIAVWTGNATGIPYIANDIQVLDSYSKMTGFNMNDPSTDQGTDEVAAFEYLKKYGFLNGTKLLEAVGVDGTNILQIKQSLELAENVFFGVALPDQWISPFPSVPGFVWDVAGDPNPSNGHAFLGIGYNDRGVLIDTWGIVAPDGSQAGIITWDAIAKYAVTSGGGELYTLLSPDIVAAGQNKTPNGIDWLNLLEDIGAIGSDVSQGA